MSNDPTATTEHIPHSDQGEAVLATSDATASTLLPGANVPLQSHTPNNATNRTVTDPGAKTDTRNELPATLPGYELAGELGRGGMGVVFQARQVTLNRTVAVKMTLGGRVGEKELIRFLAEAEAVASVNHVNVVQVYDYGESAGRMYMVLEYCPGGSLADKLRNHGCLDARAAAELLQKIAAGVAAAHEQGIIHRDLKPGNILFDRAGEPKVADFGLAKRATSDMTQTGAIMGTPAYMAPEQAGGRTKFVGPTADVWALGIILYQCLTGRRPFEAETTDVLLSKVLLDDPLPPREQRSGIPRDLEAICMRCLEKDASRRYPTATELVEELGRYLAGEPVSTSQTCLVSRLTGSLDRVRLNTQVAEYGYGTLLLVLAPVMLLPEIWATVVLWNDWSANLLIAGHCCRGVAFIAAVGYLRQWRFWPRGAAERQLWVVWGGYVLTCWGFGVSTRISHTVFDARFELELYQGWACMAALAFFVLAPTLWGYCSVIGLGYLLLSFVMALDLRWAPIEFGAAWAIVLVVIGLRLRQLGRAVVEGSSGGA